MDHATEPSKLVDAREDDEPTAVEAEPAADPIGTPAATEGVVVEPIDVATEPGSVVGEPGLDPATANPPVPAAVEPEPRPAPDVLANPADQLGELTVAVGAVQRRMDELARLGERQAAHVDALHAENQQLRRGELAQATAPFLRDLVRLHDDVGKLASSSEDQAGGDLALVRSLVLGALERWGVTAFEPAPGDVFDGKIHHGVGRIRSEGASDNTVAVVRRCGFVLDDGSVLRPAEVDVHRSDEGDGNG